MTSPTTLTTPRTPEAVAVSAVATRKTRKPTEKGVSSPNHRFFLGSLDAEGNITLTKEFPSEVEAQLESLKLDQAYHKVESWKAVADLSNGSIAVQKRPVGSSSKT